MMKKKIYVPFKIVGYLLEPNVKFRIFKKMTFKKSFNF